MPNLMIGIHVGHDASACLINEYGIVTHLREEQITKIKHFNGFPLNAVLEIGRGLASNSVDAVAFSTVGPLFDSTENSSVIDVLGRRTRYDEYHKQITETLALRKASLESSYMHFEERLHFSTRNISALSEIGVNENTPRFYVHHHLSHASCFRLAGAKYTKIVTADGRGDNVSSTAYSITDNGQVQLINLREANKSLGAFYQCATEVAGYLGVDSEYKIMGLSAYGKCERKWAESLRSLLQSQDVWRWIPYGQQYPDRSKNNPMNAIVPPPLLLEAYNAMRREDFSATVQTLFEEEMIELLSQSIEERDTVFCSGGLFLNTRCNQKLRTHFHSAKLDFFPDSGDSGLSMGCAMAAIEFSPSRGFSPFVGQKDGFERLEEVLLARNGHYIRDVFDLPDLVAELLDGKFLGLCDGRAEIGPRALGARSIIADAFSENLRFDLNKRKKREMFVPVAPSILVSDADKLMHVDGDEYYMLKTVQAKRLMMEVAPGLVHADGSVRPQLIADDDSSLLACILREVKKKKGIGIVANSSLNRSGFPTAGNIEEAMDCLDEGVVDIIVNRDGVVRKG